MTRPASRIELQIGELVLHGVAERDSGAVRQAFVHELTRLLSENGVPEMLGATPGSPVPLDVLHGGAFEAPPGAPPERLGEHAARAVYLGMGGVGS